MVGLGYALSLLLNQNQLTEGNVMFKTNKDIEFQHGWGLQASRTFTVPKGTPVEPATNLPDNDELFWVQPQDSWPFGVRQWADCYGFLIKSKNFICEG